MFKFLRKYNKFILAVGGSLLLIVFLIPQAIQQLSQQAALSGAEIATVGVDDEEVSAGEWQHVLSQAQLAQRLIEGGALQIPGIPTMRDANHWYLLTREAKQLGFVPATPTGQFAQMAEQLEAAQFANASSGLIRQTLANAQGVVQMLSTFIQAGDTSDRRLQRFAQRMFHAVGLQTVVVQADAESASSSPTEQQLQEQLAQYKDVLPGEGERGYGYKLPDRVKLEWLDVTADSVRQVIESSDRIDGRTLRRHWNENAGQRGLPPVPDEPTAVPDVVRDDLLDQLVRDELEQIEKYAYDQIRVPQRNVAKREGFYELPDDWDQMKVDFHDLASQIEQRFGIEAPTYHPPAAQWTAIDELSSIDGIGLARTDKFGRLASTLTSVIAQAREFGGSGTIPIQKSVAGPPLRGADDSVYVFRIVDTDPSRAPESVDEVREQLVQDLRRRAHYEQLVSQLDAMQQTAKTQGMLALALARDSEIASDDRVALYEPDKYFLDKIRGAGLDATPSQVPGLGDAPEVLEAIIEWARTFPATAKMDSLPAEERIRAFAAANQFAVVVVKLTKQYPVTVEDYKALTANAQLESLLIGDEIGDSTILSDIFGYDALAARHNFQPSQRPTEDDTDVADFDEGDADTEA